MRETHARAPGGIVVRPARPRDAASFLHLYRAVAAEGRFIRTERVTRTVGDYRRQFRRSWTPDQAVLVAVADDEVVGQVSIAREEHPVTRHVATFGMTVAAEWRGRGVGSALLEEALHWARAFRVEKVELTVYPNNEGAIALYRRFGFVEEGRLVRHSKKSHGYEDEILMGIWLDAMGSE
jgi:RimJ/RimL family protein N-acetyltransferase